MYSFNSKKEERKEINNSKTEGEEYTYTPSQKEKKPINYKKQKINCLWLVLFIIYLFLKIPYTECCWFLFILDFFLFINWQIMFFFLVINT